MTGFEGIGDFDSSDPYERHIAHQHAKGNLMPRTYKAPVFHAAHYNAIAKEIRELMPIDLAPLEAKYDDNRRVNLIERSVLTMLALNLTKRFKEDNSRFDPIKFLDACSPNTDLYPLSELWEND